MKLVQRRFIIIVASTLIIFFTSWLELFVQKKHHLIGGGLNRSFLFLLINAHLVMIIVLLYLIVRHSIKLFLERRKGVPGSVFTRNLLFAFILLSVVPACAIFFTAGKFITKSIDRWFQARLGNGLASGMLLHRQHTQALRQQLAQQGKVLADQLASSTPPAQILASLPDGYTLLVVQSGTIQEVLSCEARMWRTFRTVNDRTIKSLKSAFLQKIRRSKTEQIFDFYGSLYWVKPLDNAICILVYRYPASLRPALIGLETALIDYEQLQSMRNVIYVSYYFTFALLALLILFLAIWCAFYLARGISRPIQNLLDATEKIRQGQWDIHVAVHPSSDLQSLARGFNEMTDAVRRAHHELDMKNKEMLAILENISSAVFFVDIAGTIIFYNAAAQERVRNYIHIADFKNKSIEVFGAKVRTKFFEFLNELVVTGKQQLVKDISFTIDAIPRTLVVYARLLTISQKQGLLIVLEDVTDLVKTNKIKTWQQAAQQMAHEIKNPLTPIQLATQRLQRKFEGTLRQEPIFLDCTNTILQQVKIIKDLVTHFSNFASMPTPVIESVNINELVNEVLCLYRISYPDIGFVYTPMEQDVLVRTDIKKMKLVLINLLDNSVRAMNNAHIDHKSIALAASFNAAQQTWQIVFSDTGPGIPNAVKETLFLPYVSTEKKNMGLGLAIVHDIITQLGGTINFVHTPGGATFCITLPR